MAFRNSQDESRLLPPASTCSYYRPLKAFKGLERGQGAVIHSPWFNHNRWLSLLLTKDTPKTDEGTSVGATATLVENDPYNQEYAAFLYSYPFVNKKRNKDC